MFKLLFDKEEEKRKRWQTRVISENILNSSHGLTGTICTKVHYQMLNKNQCDIRREFQS